MAIFIAAPDMQRLINFFFRNKAVPAVNIRPKFYKTWMKITRITVKILLIGTVLLTTIGSVWKGYKSYGDEAMLKLPMFGIYDVIKFVKNKETLPPLATDTLQWKQLNIIFSNQATIKMMNDSAKRYSFNLDTANKTFNLFAYSYAYHLARFHYFYPDATHLVFTGTLQNDSVYILMQKIDFDKTRLISRGFHWINEYPYNK